jgi:uncharacterized protein (DUF1697 family)
VAQRLTPSHAAFLRGVNLGAQRKTGSAELRACLEGIGLEGVQTFRTSGNVIVDAGRESQAKLKSRLETALRDSFGFEIQVFLRTAKQVRAIAAHEPFPAKLVERSEGKLQVALLSKAPSAATRAQVLALATDEDRLAFRGLELYWLPSGRMRDSGLNLRAVEKLTDAWTMRTKATLELLAGKFLGA